MKLSFAGEDDGHHPHLGGCLPPLAHYETSVECCRPRRKEKVGAFVFALLV